MKISESSGLDGSISISDGFSDHKHQQNLQQIDRNEAEDTEIVHRPDGLPDWIGRNRHDPQPKLSEYVDEVENAGKNKSCHHLNGSTITRRSEMISLLVCQTK